MNATTCRPLNSITVKGSNGSSRSQLLNPSMGLPLECRNDKDLGQIGGHVEQVRRSVVENVILHLYQDRTDQTRERGVHRDRHAAAHDLIEDFIDVGSKLSRLAIGSNIR